MGRQIYPDQHPFPANLNIRKAVAERCTEAPNLSSSRNLSAASAARNAS
jgi:hypothetical protein